jgi:CheY-like chemotaxis protein
VTPTAERPAALAASDNLRENEDLRRDLEVSGWRVLPAYDAESALSILSSEPVRLGIFALDSPGMDALEIVRRARARGRGFHCVFVDSEERSGLKHKCLELGALAYLVKPVSPIDMSALLQEALERPLPEASPERRGARQLLRALTPGTRLQLSVRSGQSAGEYRAMVLEHGRAALVVSAWATDGSPIYVSLGTQLMVGFPSVQGWAEFEAAVTGCYVHNNLLHVTLRPPRHISCRQRRATERVSANLPVRAYVAGGLRDENAATSGHTENLSAKGLGAFLKGQIPVNARVSLAVFPSPWRTGFRLTARTAWAEPVGRSGGGWCRYGFQFGRLGSKAQKGLEELLEQISSLRSAAREPSWEAQDPSEGGI